MPVTGASIDLRLEEKRLGRGRAARVVLADLTLRLAPGACLAVTGPSGAGKTTLLRILAGLDDAFVGRRAPLVGRLGMVFQEPRLLPWRTVAENLALAAPEAEPAAIAAMLDRCRVARDLFDRRPHTLSLGEQRRVALARALVVEPALLVLDEPLVSLDAATADDLTEVIAAVAAGGATTIVLVDHDLERAVRLADRVVRLAGTPARFVADVAVAPPRGARDAAAVAAEAARLGAGGF